MSQYITYKHALTMFGALILASAAAVAWLDDRHESKDAMYGTKEDIKLIKECVINGKCKPSTP